MRFGLVVHPMKRNARKVARNIITHVRDLQNDGADVEMVLEKKPRAAELENGMTTSPIGDMAVDAVICIGGDGTLLRTLQITDGPVIGINVGSLGFLMDIHPEGANLAIDKILKGEFLIEERARIKTLFNNERLPDATNEVLITTKNPSKIQEFEFSIDGEWVQQIRADGIIISTPTGSTSYALSAGGSVLDPRVHAIEIVPIAPFRINSRPFIVPDTSIIDFRVAHRQRTAVLVVDGHYRRTLRHKDEMVFSRSEKDARFIRFDSDFYKRFQDKIAKERPIVGKKGKY